MESEDEWPTSAEQFLRTRKVLSEVWGVGLRGEKESAQGMSSKD